MEIWKKMWVGVFFSEHSVYASQILVDEDNLEDLNRTGASMVTIQGHSQSDLHTHSSQTVLSEQSEPCYLWHLQTRTRDQLHSQVLWVLLVHTSWCSSWTAQMMPRGLTQTRRLLTTAPHNTQVYTLSLLHFNYSSLSPSHGLQAWYSRYLHA